MKHEDRKMTKVVNLSLMTGVTYFQTVTAWGGCEHSFRDALDAANFNPYRLWDPSFMNIDTRNVPVCDATVG
jgi:hypothetical protein